MNIPHLPMNPTLQGQFRLRQNIAYSAAEGSGMTLDIFTPWCMDEGCTPHAPLPLLVFVQGSAWCTPDRSYEHAQLALFAHAGFVVATVGHRDMRSGHPFPAFLQDVKCAIRYLRANAAQYGIDPARVLIWGTSSGGNTALLVGTTGDDPAFKTEEYADQSDAVCAAVSCFGPTDVEALFKYLIDMPGAREIGAALAGSMDEDAIWAAARAMSPVNHVQAGKTYPPMLLLNGTADPTVPHMQMEAMVEKLEAVGSPVEAYYVDGAEHEGNFWSPEVRAAILEFVKKHAGI